MLSAVPRLRRSIASTLVGAMAFTGFPSVAQAADPAASLVVQGLLELGLSFGGTSSLEPLAEPLPLTDVAVRDVLELDRLLALRIADAVRGQSPTLDTLDDVVSRGDGLTFSEVTPSPDAPPGALEWDLDVDIELDRPIALRHRDDKVRFGVAGLDGELAASLVGTFRIRWDDDADLLQQFQIVGEQLLDVRAWTRRTGSTQGNARSLDAVPFRAVDGFIEADGTGTFFADASIQVRMRDPNGRGVIKREDLEFGIPEDLFTVATPAADAVAATMELDTDLVGGTTDTTLTVGVRDVGVEGPWAAVTVARTPGMQRLTGVTLAQALGSFASATGAILKVENVADADLPMLDARLTDLHSPGTVLTDLIVEQATARILCGATNTTPPQGAPRPGDPMYCQAVTDGLDVDAGREADVVWSALSPATTVTPPADPSTTVGASPTANVTVTTTTGFPHLIVSFHAGGQLRRARSVIASAQILGAVLDSVGLTGGVTYDEAAAALEFHLLQEVPDTTRPTVTGGAEALAPLTGMSGLCAASSSTGVRECPLVGEAPAADDPAVLQHATVDVDATGRGFDATIGIGLLPPAPQLDDVPDVYLRPGANGVLWSIDSVTSTLLPPPAPMAARIGFLQVDVDLVTLDVATPTGPAVEGRVPVFELHLQDDPTRVVTGAVRVPDLLGGLLTNADGSLVTGEGLPPVVPTVTRGIVVDAHLNVADGPTPDGTRLLNASGSVTAHWDDLAPGALPTVVTTPGYDDLRLFDLVPTMLGEVGAVSGPVDAIELEVPSLDLLRDLGLTVADLGTDLATIDRRVVRRGDTAGCTLFTVLSATRLRCDDPIDPDQVWAAGDIVEIEGRPDALREGLLDDLMAVVGTFESPEPSLGYDETFPLLDLKPAQVSAANRAIGDGLATILGLIGDEGDDPADAAGGPVATLQRFVGTLGDAIGMPAAPSITLVDHGGAPWLELDIDHTASEPVVFAPLRIMQGDRLLRITTDVSGDVDDVDVSVLSDSTARVRLGLDLASGMTEVHRSTQITESVLGLDRAAAKVAGEDAQYGAADWTVGAAADTALDIAVQQVTGLAGGPDWTPLGDFRGALTATRTALTPPHDCGIAGAPADAAACAVVPLTSIDGATSRTVSVALRADESSGGAGGPLPGEMPLAIRFLGDGLSFLSQTLDVGLDGDAFGFQLPLVGNDLDAGADIPGEVVAFSADVRRRLGVLAVDDAIAAEDFLFAVTVAVQQAAEDNGFEAITTEAAGVCTGNSCPADATVADLRAVEFPLSLTKLDTSSTVPFSTGLPSAPVVSQLHVDTHVPTWTLAATMGIRRGTGPYLRFDETPDAGRVELLSVHSTALLPQGSSANCHTWTRVPSIVDRIPQMPAGGPNDSVRCLDAVIGYMPSVLVDRGETGIDATVSVTVDAAGAGDDLYLPALVDGLPVQTAATGTGGLDVYFEGWASELGFFDIIGTLDLDWVDGAFANSFAFNDLFLDRASVDNALGPAFVEAREWTRTLQPVLDAVSAPIPVASDLSRKIGAGDITLLSLIVANGGNIDFVTNLMAFNQAVDELPKDPQNPDLIPLGADEHQGGSFGLVTSALTSHKCKSRFSARGTEDEGTRGTCQEPANSKKNRDKANENTPDGEDRSKRLKKRTTGKITSVPSVAFPVYTDARVSYDLLLGRRGSNLVTVDLGYWGVEVGYDWAFGPFMIGPVPVFANIGGSVAVAGRFAFGFDTDGLTRVIASEEPGDVVAIAAYDLSRGTVMNQGFYIDDLRNGQDVPEIVIVFTLYAGASVSVGIATAGLRGGAEIDLSLDAHDPDLDGRIRIHEFAGSSGRSCAFNVSSGITFFLDFFLRLDFAIKTISKSWRILQSPRIQLFEFPCDMETPTLAFTRTAGDGSTELVLTSGAYTFSHRHAYLFETKDRYTVRQLTAPDGDGNVRFEVSAFQLTQTFTVPAGSRIIADGGAGKDTFKFHPGQRVINHPNGDVEVQVIPFDSPVHVTAGDDVDRIEAGDGNDVIWGGNHDDVINAGFGDDEIHGGGGHDVIDAGNGNDQVWGDGGNDAITTGAGADRAWGGPGDDDLSGGPGVDPNSLFATTDPALIAPQLDGGDLLVGGDGSDVIDGGNGSDIVVGGDYTTAASIGVAHRNVWGVAVDGQLLEVDVAYPSVVLPTEAQIRAECEQPGAPTGSRDDVSGGLDRDYLVGGGGADQLAGGAGSDLVCGRGGDDVVLGEGGDLLPSETGDDELHGGPGRDRLYGGPGTDVLHGGAGDDLLRGEEDDDVLHGGAGADLVLGDDGADSLYGDDPGATGAGTGDGRAIRCAPETGVIDGWVDLNGDLVGDGLDDGQLEGLRVTDALVHDVDGTLFSGSLFGVSFVAGRPDLNGDGVADGVDNGIVGLAHLTGAVGDGDCLLGGAGDDPILDGQAGGDRVNAGVGDDPDVRGGDGNDLVRGGPGDDFVAGDADDDLVLGDLGDDHLEGNAGDDRLRGGGGDDLMIGGSSTAGAADGNDLLLGDRGDDVLAGGNATMDRYGPFDVPGPVPTAWVVLLDTPVGPVDADGFDDQLYGGFDDDFAYGQSGDDLVRGGHDADVVEGGPGADRVQGDDGADLVIGGSSTAGAVSAGRDATDVADGSDVLFGDGGVDHLDGPDVIVGDNARLDVVAGSARSRWPDHRPEVALVLFDVPTVAPVAGSFGDDWIDAGDGDDLVLGQSGDDVITGNGGNDAIEGNAGADTVHGDLAAASSGTDGDDAILGGSWTAGTYDASVPDAGAPGGVRGDELHGDGGADTILGDNGTVLSTVTLLDVPGPGGAGLPGTTAGNDVVFGGDGPDALFGQSGDDVIHGNDGDDAIEGDAGADTLHGDADDDAIVGGGSAHDGRIVEARRGDGLPDGGDVISGGVGDDVIAGDNARVIARAGTRGDGTALRTVLLFDVEAVGWPAPVGGGGADLLLGDAGRDLLFGQGGADTAHGGADDDVVEGNHGDDTLSGGGGEDDVLGGGSATDGEVISDAFDRLLDVPAGLVDASAAGLLDGRDVVHGGHAPGGPADGDADAGDVVLGDNGRIVRPVGVAAVGGVAVRVVAMADTAPGATSGSDVLYGNEGDDVLYGQFDGGLAAREQVGGLDVPGDLLDGGSGNDALLGDLGVDVPTEAGDLGRQSTVTSAGRFIDEVVFERDSVVHVVQLVEVATGGADVLFGRDGEDSLHAGAGDDLVNAGAGDDVAFGDDGDDAMWGGVDHDRLYGGLGADDLDVKPRPADPTLWFAVAPAVDTDGDATTVNGGDFLYGGDGPDTLQGDVGDQGRTPGDRLLDWFGAYNAYFVCNGQYGAGRIQRKPDPSTIDALLLLATADGAWDVATTDSSGWHELRLVPVQNTTTNTSPTHPDYPGNFTCE